MAQKHQEAYCLASLGSRSEATGTELEIEDLFFFPPVLVRVVYSAPPLRSSQGPTADTFQPRLTASLQGWLRSQLRQLIHFQKGALSSFWPADIVSVVSLQLSFTHSKNPSRDAVMLCLIIPTPCSANGLTAASKNILLFSHARAPPS